jgi:nitrogen fixation/metabolism regulation signal transduction histidine kinase
VNYKPTKVAGWGVVVGYDEAEFLKNQQAFRGIALLFLGATLLILAGIVITVTRYALRPLGQLAAAADEIAQRNLDCKIPEPSRNDEIGLLTRSFQSMREALKEQLLERRWASQSLEHQLKYNNLIIDSMGELVFVLTKTLNISRINPAVSKYAGYAPADVIRLPLCRVVTLVKSEGSDAAESTSAMVAALKAGQSMYDMPAIITAKNGEEIGARLTLVSLQDGNAVVGAVVTLRVGQPAPISEQSGPQTLSNS